MDESLTVDMRALQERNAKLARGFDNLPLWFVRWFGEGLLFIAVIVFGIPALVGGKLPTAQQVTSSRGVIGLLLIVAVAFLGTIVRYRNTQKLLHLEPSILEEKTKQNWRYAAGDGWLRRTLFTGLMITLSCGIPIGLLLAFDTPVAELPGQSRGLMVLAFTGMTAAWAFPVAFLMRWAFLRSLRKLVNGPNPTGVRTA